MATETQRHREREKGLLNNFSLSLCLCASVAILSTKHANEDVRMRQELS
jgi:hypothetical protein